MAPASVAPGIMGGHDHSWFNLHYLPKFKNYLTVNTRGLTVIIRGLIFIWNLLYDICTKNDFI